MSSSSSTLGLASPSLASPSLASSVYEAALHQTRSSDGRRGLDAARVAELVRVADPLLGGHDFETAVAEVLARLHGLGVIEPLLADESITEIMINGPGPVWIERKGELSPTEVVLDRASIELVLERIVAPLGLRVDRTSPLVDARLPDGSRVNAVVPPLALDGPYITIRRFSARPYVLAAFAAPSTAAMLAWSVRARANIVVSGGTGAGKTSLLNALAAHIDKSERVVTVEDAAELRLPGDHVLRLEARPDNGEGIGYIDSRTLVRNALRMRPDRIIVGEVRGREAVDMLQAMNTGHEGSLSSCHANSPTDALRRLETMVLMGDVELPLAAVRDHLRSAVDLVVQVSRVAGERKVTEVIEVADAAERVLVERGRVVALPEVIRDVSAGEPDAGWLS